MNRNSVVRSSPQDGINKVFWKIPYFQKSEKVFHQKLKSINKLLHDNVKLFPCFQTFKTSNIFKNKDQIPMGLASNVVYEYKCERCDERYIGETSRHLITRIKEHVFGRPVPTEVTLDHHPVSQHNFRIKN